MDVSSDKDWNAIDPSAINFGDGKGICGNKHPCSHTKEPGMRLNWSQPTNTVPFPAKVPSVTWLV